ncbi:hypothetical protein AB0B44_18005, partial [Streptomyces sp. NPDC041003]
TALPGRAPSLPRAPRLASADDGSTAEHAELIGQHARVAGSEAAARGLWQKVAGVQREKELIERRLVLPLAHPEMATQHGVELPRAAVDYPTGRTAECGNGSRPFVR